MHVRNVVAVWAVSHDAAAGVVRLATGGTDVGRSAAARAVLSLLPLGLPIHAALLRAQAVYPLAAAIRSPDTSAAARRSALRALYSLCSLRQHEPLPAALKLCVQQVRGNIYMCVCMRASTMRMLLPAAAEPARMTGAVARLFPLVSGAHAAASASLVRGALRSRRC